jgi:hypothetical protein
MPPYTYWAYGLSIQSDIDCPELPRETRPSVEPDLAIQLLPEVDFVGDSLENGYFEVGPSLFRLAIPGVGNYAVEDGRRISIQPLAGASIDKVRLFLLGSSMGALLYQRGLFPLHGSAVETDWGAMIFLGAQGAGKSTLAAQFHCRGYRLLTDDVCAITTLAGRLEVLPAVAQFRLCQDAYERLDDPAGARFDVDKYVVPMAHGYCPNPVPPRAIHLLCDHDSDQPEVEPVLGFDRVQKLLENLYRPQYMKGQHTQRELMRMAAEIARNVTVLSVARKRDTAAIDGLVSSLEQDWAARFGQIPAKESA